MEGHGGFRVPDECVSDVDRLAAYDALGTLLPPLLGARRAVEVQRCEQTHPDLLRPQHAEAYSPLVIKPSCLAKVGMARTEMREGNGSGRPAAPMLNNAPAIA